MDMTFNRRQLLQGTGVAVAAAAMSPLMQSSAFGTMSMAMSLSSCSVG